MSQKLNKLGLTLLTIHTIVILVTAFIIFVAMKPDLYGGSILLFGICVIYDAPFVYPALFILSSMIIITDILTRGGVPALICVVLLFGGLQWYLIGCFISRQINNMKAR